MVQVKFKLDNKPCICALTGPENLFAITQNRVFHGSLSDYFVLITVLERTSLDAC